MEFIKVAKILTIIIIALIIMILTVTMTIMLTWIQNNCENHYNQKIFPSKKNRQMWSHIITSSCSDERFCL